MKKETKLRIGISITLVIIAVLLLLVHFVLKVNSLIAALVYVLMLGLIFIYAYYLNKWQKGKEEYINENLKDSITDAMDIADVGIIVYSEDYVITYMSKLFYDRNITALGEKVLNWLPDLQDVVKGNVDKSEVVIKDCKYEVTKKDTGSVLIFKDITLEYDLKKRYEDEAPVLGLVNFDNYEELSEIEEDVTIINSEIKVLVYEYLRKHEITFKTLRNNRLFLMLNERTYEKLAADRFSILNTVRKEAKRLDMPITLSMAFARGSDDYKELDEMAANLLDLAQTRGGDQVVIRKVNEEPVYFGGSSEAREKSSKVRVRVIANSIKDLIVRSSSVIICGHLDMDADCVGAALGMSLIAQNFKKETYIITKTGGIEPTIKNVMDMYEEELAARHRFVTVNEAINHYDDNTLVIMVDHHSASQSNGSELLKIAKKVVIVDHHRRKADLDVKAILAYIEAGASSASELVMEFVPYILKRGQLIQSEANIMYMGILIDTGGFKVRTGVRTFEVAGQLRYWGADPSLVEEFNEEPYDNLIKRSIIINNSVLYKEGIMISALEDGIFDRTLIAQSGNSMLKTRGVKAVFVIAHIAKDEVAISARSKGGFNVQMIMEKMNGGGHMTQAGLQTKEYDVKELKVMLLKILEEYLKGEKEE